MLRRNELMNMNCVNYVRKLSWKIIQYLWREGGEKYANLVFVFITRKQKEKKGQEKTPTRNKEGCLRNTIFI